MPLTLNPRTIKRNPWASQFLPGGESWNDPYFKRWRDTYNVLLENYPETVPIRFFTGRHPKSGLFFIGYFDTTDPRYIAIPITLKNIKTVGGVDYYEVRPFDERAVDTLIADSPLSGLTPLERLKLIDEYNKKADFIRAQELADEEEKLAESLDQFHTSQPGTPAKRDARMMAGEQKHFRVPGQFQQEAAAKAPPVAPKQDPPKQDPKLADTEAAKVPDADEPPTLDTRLADALGTINTARALGDDAPDEIEPLTMTDEEKALVDPDVAKSWESGTNS